MVLDRSEDKEWLAQDATQKNVWSRMAGVPPDLGAQPRNLGVQPRANACAGVADEGAVVSGLTNEASILCLVLAAGKGSRFSDQLVKQRSLIGGEPLLIRSLRPYAQLCRAHPKVRLRLVLGCEAAAVRAEVLRQLEAGTLDWGHGQPLGHVLDIAENPKWDSGMASSLEVGLRQLPDSLEAVLVGLGDMPWLSGELLEKILQTHRTHPQSIICPVYCGKRGNPILFPKSMLESLRQQSGDVGGRALLAQHPERIHWLEVEEPGILQDVDAPSDLPSALPRVLIRGAGDLASGVAHRLRTAGFEVALLELGQPRMLRGRACFAQAVYEPGGGVEIEGVRARCFAQLPVYWRDQMPVVIDPEGSAVSQSTARIIVDARMLKSGYPSLQTYPPDSFVVGLGPGFKTGKHVHAVVETQRGHELGKVIWQGEAQADTGVPGDVAGESWRRLLRSPGAGVIRHLKTLGDMVSEGEAVALVVQGPEQLQIKALVGGRLRGLMRDGLQVQTGEKVGDVDPRSFVEMNSISDKARAVGGGVLEAVMCRLFGRLAHGDSIQ